MSRLARRAVGPALALIALAVPSDAAEIPFGPFDVPTVFFITSDAGDRVDYGVRLDARCAPPKDDAVFPYWRHFDPDGKTSTHPLTAFELIPYGISEQRVTRRTQTGGTHVLRLRQFDKIPIVILTRQDGPRCAGEARTLANGRPIRLASIHVQVSRKGLLPSVDWVDVHGRDLETGVDVTARLFRP